MRSSWYFIFPISSIDSMITIISMEFPYTIIFHQFISPIMDFTKLFCRIHPQQPITNYCVKQQCQVQLCANCICSHTNLHLTQGSSPNYENIRDTYKGMLRMIKEEVAVFEDVKNRVGQIQAKVREKKQKVKEIVRQARQDTIEAINIFFVNKQRELSMQIEGADKKYGLHSQARLEKLTKNSTKQIQDLVSMSRKINTLNFIESLSKIKNQYLHNARVASSQMRAQVLDNENYNTKIVYNKGIMKEVQQLLENIVVTSISRDQKSEGSRVKMSVAPQIMPICYETNKAFQQPKLFTLRRTGSQSSLPTVNTQLSNKISPKKDQIFKNVFENNDISNKQSRVTIANRRIDRLEEIEENQSYGTSSTSEFNKNMKETVLNQLPKNNYDFTFGNRIYEHDTRFARPANIRNQSEIMRGSEKWQPAQNKNYKPEFVSNFQARQINHNINKMTKNSYENKGSSDLDTFEKSSKLSESRDEPRFMYRTQFL